MRAEAQANVDRIKAALELLRRFLDWDRALRRLDELNARVEDPTLWDDHKKAQEVMRERTRLDQAISATKAIQQEMDDRSEEHTSDLQSLMRNSYAVFRLKKKNTIYIIQKY